MTEKDFTEHNNMKTEGITQEEVLKLQKEWGESIVAIGKLYKKGGDYVAAAKKHIKKFYNYQEGTVLFKPTLAAEKQFRSDFSGALSYFIGGDQEYPEDHGFAIKPWEKIRWKTVGIKIIGETALTMGNYYFTPASSEEELKVEYSFAYTRNEAGNLKIVLHDSHLPCSHVKVF